MTVRAASLRSALLCLAGIAAVAASALAAEPGDPIKIGWITELTGPWHESGNACLAALRVAEVEIDASGGAGGRKLSFVVQDNATDPARAAALAADLDRAGVVAFSGATSSDTALTVR